MHEDFTNTNNLLLIKFIESHYTFHDTTIASKPYVPKYSLSDRYFRYRVFRWNRFWDSKVWPFVISILTSIIASIITTVLIMKLGLSATP